MAKKAKHAFGSLERIDSALASGTIDKYDILFGKDQKDRPYVGWITKDGDKVICQDEDEVVFVEDTSLPSFGESGKIYLFGEDAFIWNGTTFKNLCEPTDLTDLADDIANLETELAKKATSEEIDARLEILEKAFVGIEYDVFHKPNGTVVDYRDKEIRIMCPTNTQWELQNSGENADANMYYVGIKAYAPSDDVVSFKEDTKQVIEDETMYFFDGDFAGVESDGRKYSVIWLPVANYDGDTWTYYGENSTDGKYVGWYYSVEWYDEMGKIVTSDCIRINLSNEGNHAAIEPFYMNSALESAKAYTDAQIETKIQEATIGFEVVEF